MKILDFSGPKDPISFHTPHIMNCMGWSEFYAKHESGSLLQKSEWQEADFIRWPVQRSPEVLSLFPARPEKVQLLESVDSLVRKESRVWPELLLTAALKRAFRHRIQTIDLRQTAYVISHDVSMRPLVATAIGLGFSKICLVSPENEFLQAQKKYLERRLVGVEIETVLTGDLTLQPQNGGLLLNALNLQEKKETLQEIAYFNFMGAQAIFIDLFEEGSHKTLHEEALRAQLFCIQPAEVEWAWWAEASKNLPPKFLVTADKEKQFFQNLDQGLIT